MKKPASNQAMDKLSHALRLATAKAQESRQNAAAAEQTAHLAKIKSKIAKKTFKKAKRAAKKAAKLAREHRDELKILKKQAAKAVIARGSTSLKPSLIKPSTKGVPARNHPIIDPVKISRRTPPSVPVGASPPQS